MTQQQQKTASTALTFVSTNTSCKSNLQLSCKRKESTHAHTKLVWKLKNLSRINFFLLHETVMYSKSHLCLHHQLPAGQNSHKFLFPDCPMLVICGLVWFSFSLGGRGGGGGGLFNVQDIFKSK